MSGEPTLEELQELEDELEAEEEVEPGELDYELFEMENLKSWTQLESAKDISPLPWHIFDGLVRDFKEGGPPIPIVITADDKVADGWNRLQAAIKAGFTKYLAIKLAPGLDPKEWAVKLNIDRRNITPSQAGLSAARMSINTKTKMSAKRAGELFRIGSRSVERGVLTIRHGNKKLIQAVDDGDTTLVEAEQLINKSRDIAGKELGAESEAVIKKRAKQITEEGFKLVDNKEATSVKAGLDVIAKKVAEEKPKPKPPSKLYEVIVLNTPWPDDRKKMSKLHELEIPATDNSVLFVRASVKNLPDAMEMLDMWGFKYFFPLTWNKTNVNANPTGNMIAGGPRDNVEYWVVGTKGNFKFENTKEFFVANTWLDEGEVPDKLYLLIERVCGLGKKKLEMYASKKRKGWVCHGLEVSK